MPATVIRLPDEPILIATLTGDATVDDIKEIYRQSNELMTEDDTHIFRITDVRQATITFPEMLKIIQNATQDMPSSTLDVRVSVTFVGESTWVRFARDAFSKKGFSMAAFTDMEPALESVRINIATSENAT